MEPPAKRSKKEPKAQQRDTLAECEKRWEAERVERERLLKLFEEARQQCAKFVDMEAEEIEKWLKEAGDPGWLARMAARWLE